MKWIYMRWDVLQIPDASVSFPIKFVFALDNVVEQRCVFLFQTQFTIEYVPTMLSLETLSDFATISWGI
jgi:hypothetical protein